MHLGDAGTRQKTSRVKAKAKEEIRVIALQHGAERSAAVAYERHVRSVTLSSPTYACVCKILHYEVVRERRPTIIPAKDACASTWLTMAMSPRTC
jgi:hypothetical protein